jgi:hypothetical protein
MTPVLVEFLIGLYFVVADSPVLFARPLTVGPLIRFILGVLLILLAYLKISIIR